jgi:hypothetical protein
MAIFLGQFLSPLMEFVPGGGGAVFMAASALSGLAALRSFAQ